MKYRYAKSNYRDGQIKYYRVYPDGSYDFLVENVWTEIDSSPFTWHKQKDKWRFWDEELTEAEMFLERL